MKQMIFHHICIQTNCYQESLDFYKRLFHMEVIDETKNFHGRAYNTWLKNDQFMIEMQTAKEGKQFDDIDGEHEGISHICMWVEDIEAQYKEYVAEKITAFILHGQEAIYEVNGGKLFKIKAPEGTIIEFRDKVGC